MRQPTVITCDFCHAPIDTSAHWTTISARVPDDVASEYREHVAKEYKSASGFAFGFHVGTPTHCHVDICQKCEAESLPNLSAVVAVVIITAMEKDRERAQRAHAKPRFGGVGGEE